MKRIIALLICCLVVLAGCGKAPAPVPNIGTEETTVGTDPVHEGPLDFGELEGIPSPTGGNSGSGEPAGGDASEPPASTGSATEPTQTTVPATEASEPATEATTPPSASTEPSTEPAPLTTDPDGFFNQVVRP